VVNLVAAKRPYIEPDQLNINHVTRELLLNNYVRQQKNGYRRYLQEMEGIYGMVTSELQHNQLNFPDEFYEDDMVIYIDPLDGTKGFTEGHLNHITSMIGVAIEGRPRIGIIHKLFYRQQLKQGRTYFGTPECGVFVEDKFSSPIPRMQKFSTLEPFPTEDCIECKDYDLWVCGSLNKN
jgi:hypothetical protein